MLGEIMHFEILVEDISGKKVLDNLVPRLINDNDTFRVISFKGIGHFPKNGTTGIAILTQKLLNDLPKLLVSYAKTWQTQKKEAVVIVVCDLDDKCLKQFRNELITLLNNCNPKPQTRFCIAVEEMEAWFLGDIAAIKQAYPKAKEAILKSYVHDSICGTWEKLADAVYQGGAIALNQKGWQMVGKEKSIWAENITPYFSIDNNNSPSFCYFRDSLRKIATDL